VRRQCEPRKPLRDGRYFEDRKDRRVALAQAASEIAGELARRLLYRVQEIR
jgi:hypothetical protein